MKYSDFVHESEIKHNTISYDLLTPKPLKSGEVKQDKIKIDFPKAISLLAPYTYVRVLEQIKAVVPLAAYLFLFQLLILRQPIAEASIDFFRFGCSNNWFSYFHGGFKNRSYALWNNYR